MTRIAPVRLMYNPKVLWFDAKDLEIAVDQAVIVNTARGNEFGHLADPVFEATAEDLAKLKTELKPVLRLGTEADAAGAEEAAQLSLAAMPVFRELAAEEAEDMRPIAVEYLFTCDKAIFYFEAESRVDFRELVRKLANRLHVRVDMRQIGSRDEARMMGGLGHCGQELCCKRLGGEFCPVSIRMAKEQNLSLNPQKISGVCGKLMCCLRYEYEAYKDFHARAPKVGEMIATPIGDAKVVDQDVPREVLTLLTPDDKKVKIALADMVADVEGAKPNRVTDEAWEETMAAQSSGGVFEAAFLTNKFTTESQLGQAKAVYTRGTAATAAQPAAGKKASGKGKAAKNEGGKNKDAAAASGQRSRKNRGGAQAQAEVAPVAAAPTRRKRRGEARQLDTGTMTAAETAATQTQSGAGKKTSGKSGSGKTPTAARTKVAGEAATVGGGAQALSASGNRPGQRSSGIRGNQNATDASGKSGAQKQGKSTGNGKGQNKGGNRSGSQAAQNGQNKQSGNSQSNKSQRQQSAGADATATETKSSGQHRQPRRRNRSNNNGSSASTNAEN